MFHQLSRQFAVRHSVAIDSALILALLLTFMLSFIPGCALFSGAAQAWENMTPKAKALWMVSVYDNEYAAYKARTANPDMLLESEKEILRVKKAALIRAWPLIKIFNAMAVHGVYNESAEQIALEAIKAVVAATKGAPNG